MEFTAPSNRAEGGSPSTPSLSFIIHIRHTPLTQFLNPPLLSLLFVNEHFAKPFMDVFPWPTHIAGHTSNKKSN